MNDLILIQFQNSLTSFFDEMIELFPREAGFIKTRIYIKDQADIQELMDVFTYNLNRLDTTGDSNNNTLKNMIKEKDERSIMDSVVLTEFLSRERMSYYKKFWNSFANEDKKVVWRWVDSFVSISDKYNKLKSSSINSDKTNL